MYLFECVEKEMVERLRWMTLSPTQLIAENFSETLTQHYPQAAVLTGEDKKIADIYFANMILPWSHDWQQQLKKFHQQLRPEGLLMLSCLGIDTLQELPQALSSQVKLIDMHELGDQLIHAGFKDPVLDVERIKFRYRDVDKLLAELQDLKLIEKNFIPNNIPLTITFEIIYAHAWRGELPQNPNEIKIPISQIKKA